jgi:transposase
MLTRSASGRRRRPLRNRLQDLAEGSTGRVRRRVETAALDPFRGYANAIRDGLPDAVAVLDAFHVVRLGTQVVDEVRRRVQQDTLGRRGHKDDPLYKIRGLLRHGVEHLSERQQAKITACLEAGDPTDEVNVAWQCYQQLRSIYHAVPAKGREIAAKVLDSFPQLPDPRGRPAWPDPPRLEGPGAGLLRHLRGLQRRH